MHNVANSFEPSIPKSPDPASQLVWKGDSSRSFRELTAAAKLQVGIAGVAGSVQRQLPSSGTVMEYSDRHLLVLHAVPGLVILTPDHNSWADVAFQFRTTTEAPIAIGSLSIIESSGNSLGPNTGGPSGFVVMAGAEGGWWRFPRDFVLRPATCYWLTAEVAMHVGIGCGLSAAQLLAADAAGQKFSLLSGFSPLFCLRGTPLQPLPIPRHRDPAAVDAAIVTSGSAGSAGL